MFYRTVITIYTDYDPTMLSLEDLARDAECGDSICTSSVTSRLLDEELPGDVAEFFGEKMEEDDA